MFDPGVWGAWLHRAEAALVSPKLRGDTAATRTAGLVAGFSLVPIAFVPLLALVGWLALPREVAWRVVALELGAIPVCATVPLVLRITGSTRVAGNFMLAYAFLLFGLVTYYAGGMMSPPSFWNVLIPMTAIALVGRRWAWFWTAAVLAEGVAVVWLERSGFQFTNQLLPAWRRLYWFASIPSLASLIMLAGLVYERSKDVALHSLESANAELERARDEAERASIAKPDFLAVLTHEIRTPMTAILGFADVLHGEWSERGFPERELEALMRIQRNGRELIETINDLLDLSKIEAGKLELERLAFSPAELVAEVLEAARPRAQALGLELALELGTDLPRSVQSDPARLRQVTGHLIENALAFTASGEVRVSLGVAHDPRGRCLDLRVRDTGPGIPQDRHATLFQAGPGHVPGETGVTRGLGLGLAMCKRLTELLGGQISVASELGRGSEFRVLVPIAGAAAAAGSLPHRAPQRPLGRALVRDDGP